MLIRKFHVMSYDNSGNYLSAERIQILSYRLLLLRWMQSLSGVSFLLNLLTILFGYIGLMNIALNLFGGAVFILSIAIILFIIESQQSHYALSLHLRDLEKYSKNSSDKLYNWVHIFISLLFNLILCNIRGWSIKKGGFSGRIAEQFAKNQIGNNYS